MKYTYCNMKYNACTSYLYEVHALKKLLQIYFDFFLIYEVTYRNAFKVNANVVVSMRARSN